MSAGHIVRKTSETKTMMFDISANTCADTFEKLIRAVGPKRILFGSDLPIAQMRMRRICEDGRYINFVPKGLYGGVAGDKNMREISDKEAAKLTFFMYEELKAFRRAAEKTGLIRENLEDVFYNNAYQLITSVKPKPEQLQMIWPKDRLNSPPIWTVPDGYTLRTFKPGDEVGYIRVMKLAGFKSWSQNNIIETLKWTVPNGLLFIVHNATKQIVATAAALHRNHKRGEFGWLAGDFVHNGKGSGYIVSAAVVICFIDTGYRDIYLRTDDFRIPAIKTYLKLGFEPLFIAPDMEKRWQAIRKGLGKSRLLVVGNDLKIV